MSERMDKIREFAEQARQYDVDLGRKLERDRIVDFLKANLNKVTGCGCCLDYELTPEQLIALIKENG